MIEVFNELSSNVFGASGLLGTVLGFVQEVSDAVIAIFQ